MTLAEHLDQRSQPYVEGRCQLWLGALGDHGYGVLKWKGRMWRVHRAAWTVGRGPIPPGLDVLHTCDTPPCRNIDHLFLGTHAANMADKAAKGRAKNGTHMSNRDHTEKQFNVRLTPEERDILDLERERLGLRHTGDVIRLWIGAVRERRRAIERETDTHRVTTTQPDMVEA